MPFLDIDGSSLEAQWCGPACASGPTLVFLHEGLGSIAGWRDFPHRLAERAGLRGLVYSRCGHGRSDPLPRPRSVGYLHHEARIVLPAVLERTESSDVILVGHSDGASIALIFAASRPAGLRGAVLEAPHVVVEEVTLDGIREAGLAFREGGLRRRLARQHGEQVEATFHAWHDLWLDPAFRSWSIVDLLPDVGCPLLVIQGEGDRYGTPAQVETVAARVGGPCETLILPDCGHTPHRERADTVTDAMASFVSRVCVRPSA